MTLAVHDLRATLDREAPLYVPSADALAEAKATPNGKHRHQDPRPDVRVHADPLGAFLRCKIPSREMLLDPILPAQGLVLKYAPRGVGKTYVALGIAYAVASGGSFLRWQAPKPRRVLYLDGEMPAVVMQTRLGEIIYGSPDRAPPDEDGFMLVTPDRQEGSMPDLATVEGQAAISHLTDAADLIIVDNISTLCRTGRENESEGWGIVQEWALGLRRVGKSVLFVHHAGKGGQQRGASKREDVLDTVINLRRPADYVASQGARFEVHLEKARGIHGDAADPFEAQLEVRGGAATWTMRSMRDAELERVAGLTDDGLKVRDIAVELGVSTGKVVKLQTLARQAGRLGEPAQRGRQRKDDPPSRPFHEPREEE